MKSKKILAEIMGILKKHEKDLKRRYGVKEIGVFGSYLSSEAGEESDLDILIEFEQDTDIGLLKFVELENYLSGLFGLKVDLVEKSVLKPRIGKHILKEVVYA